MKKLLVANAQPNSHRYSLENITTLLKAQIENNLDFWQPKDIIILSNFDFDYMGVKCIKIELNNFCLTGSKMFGIKWLFDNIDCEIVWTSDLDCWQDASFKCPKFKDVGATRYYNNNYNGGSIFWRNTARDIIDNILNILIENKAPREEPILNKILKTEYKNRITTINSTFNVGCTGFAQRYFKSIKPICVRHFHPYNRIAWETHALDRSQMGEGSISIRLERVIRKHYPSLPIKLKGGDVNVRTKAKTEKIMCIMQKRDTALVGNVA